MKPVVLFRLVALGAITAAILLTFRIPAAAQVETGKIVGTIHDNTGAVIPDAVITARNIATGVEAHSTSHANGEFVLPQMQPGTYSVSVAHAGFKQAEQTPFSLDVNQVVALSVTMQVGDINETIEVTSAAPLLESQTSSIGQVINEKSIHDLPLNGRDFIELAYLTPGVNGGPPGIVQQGAIPENERGNGAVQANGLTATNNNFLLNGFDNNEQQIGFEVIQPPIDAIQEFKVQTNGFGADIGKGGAVVNVVFKSGTNAFHGNVYEFLRNSAFDARNFFDDPTLPIPPFKQNQFGGTFGGPIRKDKLFFFGDYQGTRIRESQTDISTVPPLSERSGDFSDLLTGTHDPVTGFDTGQIFDPLTYDPATGARQPFQGNIIPAAHLDQAALNVVNLFPAPNRSGNANNYLLNPGLRNNQDQFDLRGDAHLKESDSLSLIFSYGNVVAHRPDPFPGIAGGGFFSGDIRDLARFAGISEIHTFSGNLVNEFKLGYSRYVVEATQNFAGQALADHLGIPGINDPSNLQATGGFPNISIANFNALGNQDFFPEFLRENNYQVVDSVTYSHGQHSFKFGTDIRRRMHGFYQPQNARGDLNFDQQYTQDLTNPNPTNAGGSSLASFLLGYPISAFRDGQKGSYGMRWWELSAYAMDDYRLSPRLTLNLGLRYDIYTPEVEQHNRLANFNFTTGQFVSPQMAGVSRSGNVTTDYNNFAPRIGFAYSPAHGSTVIRGGFGIFYDLQADQSDAELAFNPTGLIFSQSFQFSPTAVGLRLSSGFPAPAYPTIDHPFGRASAALFNNRTTYIEEWNLNTEQQLPGNAVLQLAYVGTRGVKLLYLSNLNQPVSPLDSNFGPAPNYGRPYFNTVPDIGPIRTESTSSGLIAHALEVRLEKRLSRNWSALTAYTWQHTIGQSEEDEYNEPQNTHDPKSERGNNGPDYRHQFTSALSLQLPFGKNQRFLSKNGPARRIAGDWETEGIVELYSGAAFSPTLSSDFTNTGSGAPRPDIVGNPYDFSNATTFGCPSNRQSIVCWYNPEAFAIPGLAAGQTFAHNFGNARRGILRGPAQYNVDYSLFKNFPFRESWNLEFRAEAFNLFNTPQFGLPDRVVDGPSAGSLSNTVHSSRQIQFALKLSF